VHPKHTHSNLKTTIHKVLRNHSHMHANTMIHWSSVAKALHLS